jgi:hypothetical protein
VVQEHVHAQPHGTVLYVQTGTISDVNTLSHLPLVYLTYCLCSILCFLHFNMVKEDVVEWAHPCTAMALLLVTTQANELCQATFTIRTMSVRSSVGGNPARILLITVTGFTFLLSILNVPFCLVLSSTFHMDVPYGTPIQHVQGLLPSNAYSRKGSSKRLPCPSHSSIL